MVRLSYGANGRVAQSFRRLSPRWCWRGGPMAGCWPLAMPTGSPSEPWRRTCRLLCCRTSTESSACWRGHLRRHAGGELPRRRRQPVGARDGRRLAVGSARAHQLQFGPRDRELACPSTAERAGVWSSRQRARVSAAASGRGRCQHLSFDPTAGLMLVHTAEGVLLWDTDADRETRGGRRTRWPRQTSAGWRRGDVRLCRTAAPTARLAGDEVTFGSVARPGGGFANVPAANCCGGRLGLGVRGARRSC
jgi:hypothetical protein